MATRKKLSEAIAKTFLTPLFTNGIKFFACPDPVFLQEQLNKSMEISKFDDFYIKPTKFVSTLKKKEDHIIYAFFYTTVYNKKMIKNKVEETFIYKTIHLNLKDGGMMIGNKSFPLLDKNKNIISHSLADANKYLRMLLRH
jgi:hypothetical protein